MALTSRCVPERQRGNSRLPVQPAPDSDILRAPPGAEMLPLHLRGPAVRTGEPAGERAGVSGGAVLPAGGHGAGRCPQRHASGRSVLFVLLL